MGSRAILGLLHDVTAAKPVAHGGLAVGYAELGFRVPMGMHVSSAPAGNAQTLSSLNLLPDEGPGPVHSCSLHSQH